MSVFSGFYGNILNLYFMFWFCGFDIVFMNKFDFDFCKVINICMSDNYVFFCGVGDVECYVFVRKEIIFKV